MNVFEAIKQSVTPRQAAEHYGVMVGRNGLCRCPFHDDKNLSMNGKDVKHFPKKFPIQMCRLVKRLKETPVPAPVDAVKTVMA